MSGTSGQEPDALCYRYRNITKAMDKPCDRAATAFIAIRGVRVRGFLLLGAPKGRATKTRHK
jgi:hypothetical protein